MDKARHDLFDRRSFLKSAALVSAGAALPAGIAAQTPALSSLPSLKDAAHAAGLHFGSDSDATIALQPAAYRDLFAAQCELYAASFSWPLMDPHAPGRQEWEDPNIAFAREHGLKLTGGHLAWYLRTPDWLAGMPAAAAEKAIIEQVAFLGRTYGPILYAWNVVNEAIDTQTGDSEGLRKSIYSEKFGDDYFDFIAHAAAEAAPHALRLYNDAGFEMDTPKEEARRKALLRLLDKFRKRGTQIRTVGLQSHLRLNGAAFDAKRYRGFLQDISDRGFAILLTELDVFEGDGSGGDIAARDQAVADCYARFLDTALDCRTVQAVVLWGLSDRYTWLTPAHYAGFARKDGSTARPLPFDDAFRPKPAFNSILNALRHAPQRRSIIG